VGNIAKEGEQTRITDLELSTTPLMNGCRTNDMIRLGPLHKSLF